MKKIPVHAAIPEVLSQYDIHEYECKLLQDERQTIFKISAMDARSRQKSRQEYVLRIYKTNDQNTAAIRAQFQWLRAIVRDTDLVVPRPVANLRGRDITPIKLPDSSVSSNCTLTRWVPGRRYFRRAGPGIGTLRQVGRFMAKLHLHGQQFERRKRLRCPTWDWNGLFGGASPWYPANSSAIDSKTNRILARVMLHAERVFKQLGAGPSAFGLIHGDMIQSNYLLHRGKVAVIDFADFGRGYFLYDMAVTLLMLRQFDRYEHQRSAFLSGYKEVRAIAKEHEAMLDIFIAMRITVLARWILGAVNQNPISLAWAQGAIERNWISL